MIAHAAFADQDGADDIVAEGASVVHGEPPQDENGPPKVDSQVEVLHEKATKQIIKEGHGQKPSKYSTCFCESIEKLLFSHFNCLLIIDFTFTKVQGARQHSLVQIMFCKSIICRIRLNFCIVWQLVLV